jgi:hypothetical protein
MGGNHAIAMTPFRTRTDENMTLAQNLSSIAIPPPSLARFGRHSNLANSPQDDHQSFPPAPPTPPLVAYTRKRNAQLAAQASAAHRACYKPWKTIADVLLLIAVVAFCTLVATMIMLHNRQKQVAEK